MSSDALRATLLGLLTGLAIAVLPPGSASADLPRWIPVGLAAAVGLTGLREVDRWDLLVLCPALAMLAPAAMSEVPALGVWAASRTAVLGALVIGARRLPTEQWARLLPWVAAGVALQGMLGVGQALGLSDAGLAVLQTGDSSYAVHGTLGHRNVLAGTLAVTAPLAWVGVHPGLGLLLGLGAVATGSAGAALGLLAALAVLAWHRLPSRWRTTALIGGGLAAVAAFAVVAGTGASGRVPIWRTSLLLLAEHPLWGVGPGQLGNAYLDANLAQLHAAGAWDAGGTAARHAHLEVLHAAAEAGVIGGVAWLLGWVVPTAHALTTSASRWSLAGIAAVAVALGQGLVSFPLELAVPGSIAALGLGMALGRPEPEGTQRAWAASALAVLLLLVPLGRRAMADRAVYTARAALLEEPELAAKAAARALDWFPAEGQAAYWLGMARWKLGDLPGAEQALRESLRTNDHHVGRRDLGLLLAELGRSGEAIDWLEDYLWIHPGSSERAFLVLGAAYLDEERPLDAVDAFDRCQCVAGFHYAGDVLMRAHQPAEALYRWRQADDDPARLKQLEHHLREGELEAAKQVSSTLDTDEAKRAGVALWQRYGT